MPRKKAGDNKVAVGNIRQVSGKVTIAGGDIYEGYTAEQVSLLLTQITAKYQRKPFDGRCPYKGLDVFEEEDADLFFGRERLADDLVNRVKESRTVFITGPSGSGKSSLVRAGLIHALKQGAIKNLHSERWLYETMKPGREPLKDLALAFSRLKSPELADYFQSHAHETDVLNKCAESVMSSRKDQRFLLFVDQFEEVFTQINQEDERRAFINMLAHASTVENGRVIVLFAMRSDFVSNCATYPALNELLGQEFRQIGAMQPEELVAAIALPAKQVGLPIEDELIARIINDMKGEPGALPLMQFALKDLFDSQQEKGGVIELTLKDYLRHGGIHKSLERHADKSFAKLSEGEQHLARSIFSGLIEIGRGTVDTRRTALFDELVPANASSADVLVIVQKLADARLIITDEQAGKDTVTISHEKLIEAWPWLKKLVNENRDVIALQNETASDAKEWEDHQRDQSYLYTGARLANAREQLESKKLVLSGLANEFVQSAIAQQRRKQLTNRVGVAVIGLAMTVAVIVFSVQSSNSAKIAATAQAASTEAIEQKAVAQAASTLAVEQAEEAQKQKNIALARQLAAQAQTLLSAGNSKQQTAVLLAIQSMRLFPNGNAAQILQNNSLPRTMVELTHDAAVSSIAFSPDGKFIVSGSLDGTVHVWDTVTGKENARMMHDDEVRFVAFSPDGKYIVSGGCDKVDDNHNCTQGSARVWDAMTGRETARKIYDDEVKFVTFSSDGKFIASVVGNNARVWEVATDKEINPIIYDDLVTSLAFSPDGKFIVTAGCDEPLISIYNCQQSSARVWEVATGREVTRMIHDNGVTSLALSRDGKFLVTISGPYVNAVDIWEVATGKEKVQVTPGEQVNAVTFSPDGKFIVSGGCDYNDYGRCFGGSTRVLDASTGTEVARMAHNGAPVESVAFSPDGKFFASGGCDNYENQICTKGSVSMWNAATGTEITRVMHDDEVRSVIFSPDGNFIASVSGDIVRVWSVSINKEKARMAHDGEVSSMALSLDGRYVVSGGCDDVGVSLFCVKGSVHVWDIYTGDKIAVAQIPRDSGLGSNVYALAFSPDGNLVASAGDGIVFVWNAATGKEITRVTHTDNGQIFSVAFSPDGKYIVSGSWLGTVLVSDAMTGKEMAQITHGKRVNSVAFSPDGKYVVSGGCAIEDDNHSCTEGSARVWNAMTGKEINEMRHDGEVTFVVFSPDGKFIVSASGNTAFAWNVTTGKEVARMIHGNEVSSVALSPDGRFVVSGSVDGTARVWDVATGKEIIRLIHDSGVRSVAFSPDGKFITSVSGKAARVWEVATGKEMAAMTVNDYATLSIAFSPDGKYVISAGCDQYKTIRCTQSSVGVWVWQPDDLIAESCSRVSRNLTLAEWQEYFSEDPYQAICPNLPFHTTVVADAVLQILSDIKVDNRVKLAMDTAKEMLKGNSYNVDSAKQAEIIVKEVITEQISKVPEQEQYLSFLEDAKVIGLEIQIDPKFFARIVQGLLEDPNDPDRVSIAINRVSEILRTWSSSKDPDEEAKTIVAEVIEGQISQISSQDLATKPIDSYLTLLEEAKVNGLKIQVAPESIARVVTILLDDRNDPNRVQTAINTASNLLNGTSSLNPNEKAEQIVEDAIFKMILESDWKASDMIYNFALLENAHAMGLEITNAEKLNEICWDGSILGYAKEVLQYCEQAVALEPDNADIRDSRGLARALTGDYPGAIEDFQFFVDHVDDETLIEQRQQWIIDLRAGKNSFTPEVLEQLRY